MIGLQIFAEWIFTLSEVILYFVLVHAMKPDQFPEKKQRIFLTVIAGSIASGVVLLNLVNFTSMLMTMLYAFLVFTIGASILYKGKFVELFFINLIYLSGLNLVEGILLKIVGILGSPEIVKKVVSGFSMERLLVVSVFKLIEIIMVFGICRLIPHLALKLKASWKVVLISFAGCIASIFWVIQTTTVINLNVSLFESVVGAVCVLVCYLCYFLLQLWKIRQEQEYTAMENKLLRMNYEAAEESYESNAILYHDMKNHFLLLQTYMAEGKHQEAQEYLQKLSGESTAYSVEKRTGVEAIDYILSQKVVRAESLGIDIAIQSEYPKDCGIDPVDLCTILTNLLDNAIEACAKQQEGADRKINLTIRRIHQFIIIKLSNTTESEPVIKNDTLITSKQDVMHHGWGLKSVRSAVEKYQGTIKYKYEEHLFTVSVMMFYQ